MSEEDWKTGRLEDWKIGRLEDWKGGSMNDRRNVSSGYRQLRVWEDARDLYALTWDLFRAFPYELKRVVANQIASVDSIHRNIAEGYCRRTINEYLQHLNIALGSAGESVSAMHVYLNAKQISEEDFERWDTLAFRLENGMKKLIASIQTKRESGEWQDSFMVRESNAAYG